MSATASVSFSKVTKTHSQSAHTRLVAQQVKSMTRLRTKGHRDWAGSTDAEILAAAESMARIYGAGTVVK
jgi:hypothetical protein